jgi:hypothetical protein
MSWPFTTLHRMWVARLPHSPPQEVAAPSLHEDASIRYFRSLRERNRLIGPLTSLQCEELDAALEAISDTILSALRTYSLAAAELIYETRDISLQAHIGRIASELDFAISIQRKIATWEHPDRSMEVLHALLRIVIDDLIGPPSHQDAREALPGITFRTIPGRHAVIVSRNTNA